MLLHNDTEQARDVTLKASLGEGWTPVHDTLYHLDAHSTYPAQLFLTRTKPLPPSAAITQTPSSVIPVTPIEELSWTLSEGGKQVGEASLAVYMEYNGVPQ